MTGLPRVRLEASSRAHAESLGSALAGFAPRLVNVEGSWQLELDPDGRSEPAVELLVRLGTWLEESRVAICRVHVGDDSYTLLAPPDGQRDDPGAFLVERMQQLERALESRIAIEQAKGKLAERLDIDVDRAFEVLRRAARNNGIKIHELAERVVSSGQTPPEITAALRR